MANKQKSAPSGIFNRIGFAGSPYPFKNKQTANLYYMMQYFNRTLNMFEWHGLDDVKKPYDELFQQLHGYCVMLKCNDTYYLTPANFGGECDIYYFPKEVIVANPWANDIDGFNGIHYVNKDCVILKNDSTMCGLYPVINRYTSMLVENDISLLNTDILSRIVALLSVTDDKGKKEAERYINRIVDGDFSVFASPTFLDDVNLKAQPISNTSSSIMQELIEFEQYLKGALSHELGINYSFNMKREALNTAESELNNQYLIPLVDDMLQCRKQFCENVKDVFGLDINVELASVWANNQKTNEAENELLDDAIDGDIDAIEETEIDEDVPEDVTEDTDNTDDDNDDDPDAIEETEIDEDVPEGPESTEDTDNTDDDNEKDGDDDDS